MDETGFAFDPKSNKTIHIRGEKNAFCISSGSKAQVTVIACVSAAGQAIPPLIVWKRKTMVPEMVTGEIPGTVYGFSKNGWTNSIIFDSWFRKLFMRYAPASRPIILFMDGHTSHYFPDTVAFAAENGVILYLSLFFILILFFFAATKHNSFNPATGQRGFWSVQTTLEESLS